MRPRRIPGLLTRDKVKELLDNHVVGRHRDGDGLFLRIRDDGRPPDLGVSLHLAHHRRRSHSRDRRPARAGRGAPRPRAGAGAARARAPRHRPQRGARRRPGASQSHQADRAGAAAAQRRHARSGGACGCTSNSPMRAASRPRRRARSGSPSSKGNIPARDLAQADSRHHRAGVERLHAPAVGRQAPHGEEGAPAARRHLPPGAASHRRAQRRCDHQARPERS